MNKPELLKSKHFCLMPWIHLHAWPNGNVLPCCMSEQGESFGNTNKNPIKEIINSEPFKKLRQNMLANKASSACTRCYELESSSDNFTLRKNSLASFGHLFEEAVSQTNEDGSLNNFKMSYMDLRFSNVCNFKCRTCSPDFSSSWQEESAKGAKTVPFNLLQNEKFWPELESMLMDVEEVCFAGGEPLVSPEHYRILKFWIKSKKTDVRLRYTTNFSHFKFKADDLLNLWKEFKDVRVAASLDANGERGEYLRKGTHWAQIEKNRVEMIARAPHVYFEMTPTLSVYNAFNLPDFHRDWIEKKLIDPDNIRINFLLEPWFMRAQIFSDADKQKLKLKYEQHIGYLSQLGSRSAKSKADFENAVKFILQEAPVNGRSEFIKYNNILDVIRSETFLKTFPELEGLLHE